MIPAPPKDGVFFDAIKTSYVPKLEQYIQNGLPKSLLSRGLNHVRNVEVLHMLLDAKADINPPEVEDGYSPLMMAICQRRSAVAEAMIAAKADINYTTSYGKCPLIIAAERSSDCGVALLKAGAEIPTDPIGEFGLSFFLFAIYQKAHSLVEAMLPSADLTAVDKKGLNFVSIAAHFADEEMIRLVLKHATIDQINHLDDSNYTAVSRAATFNTVEVVRLLIDAKAEVIRTKGDPITVKAVTRRDVSRLDMLKLLLDAKIGIDACTYKNNTALHVAALLERHEVVDYLISRKADVNILNNRQLTPLVAALSRCHVDIAATLLAAGGTAPGRLGGEQLIVEAMQGNEETVDILLKAKAEVNMMMDNTTALMEALKGRHIRIVEKLIAAGAKPIAPRPRKKRK
jgi:ankyrin repeat protein